MIVDYVNYIPLWVNSDNKRYDIDGLEWVYDSTNFSNAQFIGLDTLIITRKAQVGDNLYIRIKNEYNQEINRSLKTNVSMLASYWYTTNVEAVANGTYVYTFKLDKWATYCMKLLKENNTLPLLHRRSHLHTTNSKFAEDELFSSVQKTVVGYRSFGRHLNTNLKSWPCEKLTLAQVYPYNEPFTNTDIYYVFRDKPSGGYRCFPLINGSQSTNFVENVMNQMVIDDTILRFLPKMNIYDKNGNLLSYYNGSGDPGNGRYGMYQSRATQQPWYFNATNTTYWTDNVANEWYNYINRNSYKKAECSFFIPGTYSPNDKFEVADLHWQGLEFKLPLRDYSDIYVNIYQEEEFDYINFYYMGMLIYQRQILHVNTSTWKDYKYYVYILYYGRRIPNGDRRIFLNTGEKLNELINDIDNINDFVGIYRWIPVIMLNDEHLRIYTVKNNYFLCYMLDKNGTYPSGQQFLDGGYMDMFIDRARDPKLNVSNYVMSWNTRCMMETKWFDNIIDPRLHFGTYGNNQEKTSIGIFGFFWFNESGFKWTKTSDYGRVENTTLHLGGALVSSTSEYKQYISSQLSTLETGYNLQKAQSNLDKSRNNFNSVFNGLSSITSAITAPLQAFGKLMSKDVGGAIGSLGSGFNATLDMYRNIGNTVYTNKQANLDLKKVKDTTIATVSDKFRASTNQMEQSSTKDMTLAATVQRPNGFWFIQEKLHKQTIMGYNNINVMYGFVNNEYLKLLDTIYKSDTETKLSWIELDEEDVRVKLAQYFNANIPYQFHEEMFKILTTGFRLWSGRYENYGNWIYDN